MKHFKPEELPAVFSIAQELWLDQGAPHHELYDAFCAVDWDRDADMDGAEPIDLKKVEHEVRTMETGEVEVLCCGEDADIQRLGVGYPEAHRCASFLFEELFK